MTLPEENNLLNIRLQELESRYERVREEAKTLSDENKSLMTVIRLLNKESQVATKEEGKNIARDTDRRTAEATSSPTKSKNDRITVVVGDSIITVKAGQAYPPRFY